jgi:hypothetical protein
MAQNTYTGGTYSSQDSIMQYPGSAADLHQAITAAETSVNIAAAFMHTQYHENSDPNSGDDENGFSAAFQVGANALLPNIMVFNTDLYTSLSYEFSAGNLDYGGHYLISNAPAMATDRAVFNRIEARIGVGFPLAHGVEVIPFFAAGYQAWNRNIETKNTIGSDEFYSSGLFGVGVKLDVPLNSVIVVSATGEFLGLVGTNITNNNFDFNHTMGPSGEERFELGLDYAVQGPFHVFGTAYLEHFNYSGFKGGPNTYYLYEPLSTTTQFGANIGVGYSF